MSQPPLKAIQCFCIAAQHLSFKQAAQDLAVTSGAVSQQVRLLENWLGFALFHRRARSIELTDAGHAYYRSMAPLMGDLVNISRSVKQVNRTQVVRLGMPPSFAMMCIGRHLPALRQQYPHIELRIQASAVLHSVEESGADLAVRYLPHPDPALDCTLLYELDVFPVCSPDYLETHPALTNGRLDGVTLIHDILHQDWHRLIHSEALSAANTMGLHCDQSQLALEAAEQGLGLALSDRVMAGDALSSGRLVKPLNLHMPARRNLYLVHRRSAPITAATCHVKRWLMDSLQEERAATPPTP